jgi:hypothetical protein
MSAGERVSSSAAVAIPATALSTTALSNRQQHEIDANSGDLSLRAQLILKRIFDYQSIKQPRSRMD